MAGEVFRHLKTKSAYGWEKRMGRNSKIIFFDCVYGFIKLCNALLGKCLNSSLKQRKKSLRFKNAHTSWVSN